MALEKLLPGHGPLPPAAVPVGSRSPLLSPGTASGCREQPVPSWLAGSTCPSHACPGKHRNNAGPRETLGTAILHGANPWERGGRVERETLEEAPSTLPALAGDIVLLGECPSDQTSI